MAWRIEIDRTHESAEWTADGQLVMSNHARWDEWCDVQNHFGGCEVAIPGCIVKLPPRTEVEAFACVRRYFDTTGPRNAKATVTGTVPDVSTLWLAPGEQYDPERVY